MDGTIWRHNGNSPTTVSTVWLYAELKNLEHFTDVRTPNKHFRALWIIKEEQLVNTLW